MPKRSRGRARPPIARTSGQSASAIDKESLHGETNKTSGLALDTVEPGEVMSGNQGVKISDDQNSLKAGPRGPTLMEDFHLRETIPISTTSAYPSGLSMRAALRRTACFGSMRICRT